MSTEPFESYHADVGEFSRVKGALDNGDDLDPVEGDTEAEFEEGDSNFSCVIGKTIFVIEALMTFIKFLKRKTQLRKVQTLQLTFIDYNFSFEFDNLCSMCVTVLTNLISLSQSQLLSRCRRP